MTYGSIGSSVEDLARQWLVSGLTPRLRRLVITSSRFMDFALPVVVDAEKQALPSCLTDATPRPLLYSGGDRFDLFGTWLSTFVNDKARFLYLSDRAACMDVLSS